MMRRQSREMRRICTGDSQKVLPLLVRRDGLKIQFDGYSSVMTKAAICDTARAGLPGGYLISEAGTWDPAHKQDRRRSGRGL
jgi:hypothetical protein